VILEVSSLTKTVIHILQSIYKPLISLWNLPSFIEKTNNRLKNLEIDSDEVSDLNFDNKTGTYTCNQDNERYCAICRSNGKRQPMINYNEGWQCPVCRGCSV
jgi:hypothetical protein